MGFIKFYTFIKISPRWGVRQEVWARWWLRSEFCSQDGSCWDQGKGKKWSEDETWASWWRPLWYCENHEHRKTMEKGKCMHKLLQWSPPLQDSLGEILALLKTWDLPLNLKQQECPPFLLTLLCLPAKREALLGFAKFCIYIFQIFSKL